MAIEDTSLIQSLVGRLQGAAKFFIADGGKLEGADGGIMELEAGFKFYFEDSDGEVDVEEMRYILADKLSTQRISVEDTSATGDFSVMNLPANVGNVYLSLTSNTVVTGASFYMTSCVKGQDVWIHLAPGSQESAIVALAMSGCSLVYLGNPFTSLTLYNSQASNASVHLRCINDDEWTVIGEIGADGMIAPS